jgi:hypothetical protein
MKISCNDENVKFFGNKIFNVILTIFKFCGLLRKIVRIKEEEMVMTYGCILIN